MIVGIIGDGSYHKRIVDLITSQEFTSLNVELDDGEENTRVETPKDTSI